MSDKIVKEKNFISIVTYVRNNEKQLEEFLLKIDNFLNKNFLSYEFIFVNDNSTDKSVEVIKQLASKVCGNVIVTNLAWKHNIDIAMLSGVDIAIGDFILEFDFPIVDFEVQEIMKVYRKCLEGYDVVAASANKALKISSKLFYNFLNKVSYRNMDLTTETFRIISRRALNRILSSKEKVRYRKALYHYSGFNTQIVKYNALNNKNFDYDISLGEKFNIASDILVSYSNIGIKIASSLSIIFLLCSLLAGGYAVYSYHTVKNIEPGWTTLMLFLSLGFTGMFLTLSVIAKYLTTILIEVQDRPNYIFKSVDRLSKK